MFGDRLILEPVRLSAVRRGDIVVYRVNRNGGESESVHRVTRVMPNGLVVQGDNNRCPDKTLVTSRNLIGRVTHAQRGCRIFDLPGRRFGLIRARTLQLLRSFLEDTRGFIRNKGRGSYGRLRNTGLISHFWQPSVVKLRLTANGSRLVKYVFRGHTVGYHWLDKGSLKCRKPFDLVLWHKEMKTGKTISTDSENSG